MLSIYSISFVARYNNSTEYGSSVIIEFSWAYFMGILFFLLGYLYLNPPVKVIVFIKNNLLKLDLSNKGFFSYICFISIVLMALSFPYLVKYLQFNPQSYVETAVNYRLEENKNIAPISEVIAGIGFPLIISILLYKPNNIFKQIPKLYQRLVSIFLIFYISLYTYLSGSKTAIIIFSLLFIIPIHYQFTFKKKYKFKRLFYLSLISFSVLIYPLIILQTHIRFTSDLFLMKDALISYVSENPLSILPFFSGEFLGCSDTLAKIIQGIQNQDVSYNFGGRWMTDLITFVPNFLFSERPEPTSEYFVRTFYPFLKEGAGKGWFILSDGYWAFGLMGVAIISLLYGYILRISYEIINGVFSNNLVLSLYQIINFTTVITAVRTGFFGTLKMYVIYMILLLAISYLYQSLPKKNQIKKI